MLALASNIDQPVAEVDADKEDRYTGYRKGLKDHRGTIQSKRSESVGGRILDSDSGMYSRTNSKSVLSRQGENAINPNPFISRNQGK